MARFTNGWVKVHRKMADAEWSQLLDINSKGLLMELLMMANYKPGRFRVDNQIITLEPGQIVTSIKELMTRLHTSKFIIQTRLDLLTKLGTITQKTGKRGRIITICKYKEYQDDTSNHLPTDLPTLLPTESPTVLPTLLPLNEELKNIKNKRSKEGGAKNPPPPVDKFLELYRHEMRQRYKVDLVITSKMKIQAKKIVQESGDLALQIPKVWLSSNNEWHLKRMHSLECLLNDLESILLCVRMSDDHRSIKES